MVILIGIASHTLEKFQQAIYFIFAAVLYTCCLPAKALRMLRNLNCNMITRKTFFHCQNSHLHPTISIVWERQQRNVISELMEEKQGLILGVVMVELTALVTVLSMVLTLTSIKW